MVQIFSLCSISTIWSCMQVLDFCQSVPWWKCFLGKACIVFSVTGVLAEWSLSAALMTCCLWYSLDMRNILSTSYIKKATMRPTATETDDITVPIILAVLTALPAWIIHICNCTSAQYWRAACSYKQSRIAFWNQFVLLDRLSCDITALCSKFRKAMLLVDRAVARLCCILLSTCCNMVYHPSLNDRIINL